jgi:hypothetical protein
MAWREACHRYEINRSLASLCQTCLLEGETPPNTGRLSICLSSDIMLD